MRAASFLDTHLCMDTLLKILQYLQPKKTKLVGHFFGKAPFPKTSFPASYLGKPRYVPFEEIFLPVPARAERYLETRFGPHFMELPDEATRRQYQVHAEFVDINHGFENYE